MSRSKEELLAHVAKQMNEARLTGCVTINGKKHKVCYLLRCWFCGEFLTTGMARKHFGPHTPEEEERMQVACRT
jgi:hypothetical protein